MSAFRPNNLLCPVKNLEEDKAIGGRCEASAAASGRVTSLEKWRARETAAIKGYRAVEKPEILNLRAVRRNWAHIIQSYVK
jgi:hypothetical protein